ncbi:polyamine ABC transporter substrate-binding protein [Rhizobium sp. PEPV16]|uniref:polyamine ABC transporter substrate-binding protein n=1 Tax=Rhizobium sp. PEPV16 TaxID=1820614 RepID=UPI00124EEB33|nr:polyamine ABC transporter substrate-binding protein [Rhizobium sp. PEPV16]KAF5887163.1 polyamine ABC transporter substrate-binding protein [Rhizobium sp. PEPV16]
MKVATRIAASLAVAFGLASHSMANERVVHVYNWSDYIDPEILEEFTKETGITVVYDVFDDNGILEAKLLAGGSGYDVVVPGGPFLARQIAAGALQKLDKSKLPNLANLWPEIAERLAKYDPGNQYAVNYMWGTTSIGYNADKLKAVFGDTPIDSWDIIFKPEYLSKLKDCGVNILDAPDETIALAINYLEKDPDSKLVADLKAAADLYRKSRPYVRTFNSSAYINDLANGDICLAVGWSGDILQAKARATEAKNGVKIELVVPKEGAYVWFDNLAIPGDAKNVDEAHAFINYLMRPDVIAKASNYVQYANGNLASQKLIDEIITGNPAVYPPEKTMAKLFSISPYNAHQQRLLNRLWVNIKTNY